MEAEKIMRERFGKDSIIALATVEGSMPCVRNVDAYYENGAFYIITHALSNKMKQLAQNPNAAIAGEWFNAHETGASLGTVSCSRTERDMTLTLLTKQHWHLSINHQCQTHTLAGPPRRPAYPRAVPVRARAVYSPPLSGIGFL